MEETPQFEATSQHTSPEVSAWLVLLISFGIFCVLVSCGGIVFWRYYATATRPLDDALLRVHVQAGVLVQVKNSPILEKPERLPQDQDPCVGQSDICKFIAEGTRIRVESGVGYGQVASLVLADRTQLDLWAHPVGADLVLDQYAATRWTNRRQSVTFRQLSGYVRYDITEGQPFEAIDYTIEISRGIYVSLAPGGSYSIRVIPPTLTSPLVTASGVALRGEIAVRSGRATVWSEHQRQFVNPDQKLQIDWRGQLEPVGEASWELISDGDFTRHSSEEYNAGSDTWSVVRGSLFQNMPAAEQNGTFRRTEPTCPPDKPDICTDKDQVYIGQFRRSGGQQKPFLVAITQTLDADVSEYPELRFSAWVRVLTQTVSLTGVAGSECPIMLRLTYQETSPTDTRRDYVRCFFTGTGLPFQAPGILYRRIPPYSWYHLDNIDLRKDPELKKIRYIQEVSIEARGHDYLSEITAISLIGKNR